MSDVINKINSLAQETNARFISFKFIDQKGRLQQIDSLVSNVKHKDNSIIIQDLVLVPVDNKIFLDPFRSYPTIFCYCENLNDQHKSRSRWAKFLDSSQSENHDLECAIEFTATNKINNNIVAEYRDLEEYRFLAEPTDCLANLRAEIVLAFENAGVNSIYHYATSPFKSIISFRAKNFLELGDNYIIAKYIIENMSESYGKSTNFNHDINNKELFNSIYLQNYNQIFVTKFASKIKDNFDGKLLSLSFNMQELAKENELLSNRLKISFAARKINPYLIFSFLNTNNYKDDNMINEILDEEDIKTVYKS